MIIDRPNPSQVTLQVTAHNLDGTPKTSLASAAVRVFHMNGATEVVDLASIALAQVGSSNVWRYIWTSPTLPVGQYYAEYSLTDDDGADFVDLEAVTVQDFATETTLLDVQDGIGDIYDWTEISQYQGAIHYNIMDGTAGQVVGVNGLPHNPCLEEADMQALAGLIGLRRYSLQYGAFYMTQDHNRWHFGGGANGHVKLDSAYTINESSFENVQISGTPSGNNGVQCYKCIIWDGVKGLWGVFFECGILGNLYLGAGDHLYQNCMSQASPYCVFDCQGNTVRVKVAGFNGEIHLRNFSAGSYADFDMASGKVTLESSCTGGIVEVRGETELVDQTTDPDKPILVNRAAVNQRDVIQTDVELIKQLKIGAWEIVNNQMIYYDTDGVEIMRQNLFDINGFPTNGINMYSREPV